MKLTLYGLKTCDSCRKARTSLAAAGHEVTFIDIRAEAPLEQCVPLWLDAVGADALINRRSTSWRALSEEERQTSPADLLLRHPTLIKRPVIDAVGQISVGWTKTTEATLT